MYTKHEKPCLYILEKPEIGQYQLYVLANDLVMSDSSLLQEVIILLSGKLIISLDISIKIGSGRRGLPKGMKFMAS